MRLEHTIGEHSKKVTGVARIRASLGCPSAGVLVYTALAPVQAHMPHAWSAVSAGAFCAGSRSRTQ